MTEHCVLVVGSTSRVGAPLVRRLLAGGAEVRAGTPERPARGPAGLHRATVRVDLNDPRTWPAALTGADRLYLVRPSAVVDVRHTIRPFLERAAAAGVGHVVFQSIAAAPWGVPHRQVEDDVDEVGLPRTFLRPTTFHQRLLDTYGDQVALHDRLRLPAGRGRTSFVDARDVAEVAARILLTDAPDDHAAYTLTGTDSLSGSETAALLTRVLGREIRFDPISLQQYRKELLSTGADLTTVRVQLLLNASVRLVLGGATDPTLHHLLGRPPITLAEFCEEHREHWLPSVR